MLCNFAFIGELVSQVSGELLFYPRDLEEPSGGKDGLIMCCYLRPIKTKFIRFFFFLLFLFFLPRLTIPPVFFPRHSCFYLASNFFSKHGIITGEIHYCFTQLLSRIGGSIWKNIFRVISFYLSRICMGIICDISVIVTVDAIIIT